MILSLNLILILKYIALHQKVYSDFVRTKEKGDNLLSYLILKPLGAFKVHLMNVY